MENKNIITASIVILTLGLLTFSIIYDKSIRMNGLTGNQIIPTKVNLLPFVASNCSFHLYQDVNLVSFYCLGMWEELTIALEPLNSSYDKIFYYEATDSKDPWKSYKRNLPNWTVQQLTHLDRVHAYWIFMNEEADYNFPGARKSTLVQLLPGWNLVGYPGLNNKSINDSLNGLLYASVVTFDNPTKTFNFYIPSAGNNTFFEFSKYSGYWIYSNATQNWDVN